MKAREETTDPLKSPRRDHSTERQGKIRISERPTSKRRKDESGSSLIFAMVFLVVSGLIVISLENMAKNDLGNTPKFSSAHALQSAANSAAELALNSIRYNFTSQTLNASPPQPCWTAGPTPSEITLNGQSVSAWCSTKWSPLSKNTRVVTIYSCKSSLSSSLCALNPLLEAKVTFDDYPSPMDAVSAAQCTSTCGVGMTINSWVIDATPPTVTSVSPATGSSSGGTSLTITGTGFVTGAEVEFIDIDTSTNVILYATHVDVVSPTTITATTPTMATGTTYYVTVTTPSGTSQYGPTYN